MNRIEPELLLQEQVTHKSDSVCLLFDEGYSQNVNFLCCLESVTAVFVTMVTCQVHYNVYQRNGVCENSAVEKAAIFL
jgi:hypothetical protein